MTVSTICPTDDSTLLCPDYEVEVGAPFLVPPEPPDPGTGVAVWHRGQYGPRVQVRLCRPVTHEPICELRTARVDSWTDRFGKGDASMTVALGDPGWLMIPQGPASTVRGRTVVRPDLKAVEVLIGLDGARQWVGFFQDPLQWDTPRITFKAVSAEAMFEERTLGATEQHDFYEGRGSFPSTDLTGWSWEPSITTSWNTTDPYEGARSLRITTDASVGGGWLYGPWVNLPGVAGQTRYPVGSVVIRAADAMPVVVGCFVQALDGSAINPTFTVDNFGDNDDTLTDWQIVSARGRMLPESVPQRVRVGVHIPRSVSIDVDLERLQWPTLTGFPSAVDLGEYPGRILRDAQDPNVGGSDWGIPSHVVALTGTTDHLTFAHQDDHPVNECIATITDADGGPDVWVTAGMRMLVAPRRGSNRADVSLTDDRIQACVPSFDVGGQVDELRATTDIGSGAFRHVFAYDAPRRGNRRRIRKLVPAPAKIDYDTGKRWTVGQGEFAAREPVSASVTVDMAYGLRFNVGDGTRFAWSKENWAEWERVRVGERTVKPRIGKVVMQVGLDPVVTG